MRLDRGAFDAMPVSVISDSTVSALCALAHVPGNELRFRPNVVVTLDSGAAFEEDEWVGSAVRIGAAVVRWTAETRDASSSTWTRPGACPIRTCSR